MRLCKRYNQEVLGHLWIRTAAATPQHHMSANFLVALLFAYACAQPPCKPLPAGCKDYKVVAGDACYRIAGKTETTFDYLFKKVGSCGVPCDANLNVGDVLAACPTPNYPPKECSWYKVKGGDSCTTIATAYNSHNITEGGFPPNGINCDSGSLQLGDELLVCGGKPPAAHLTHSAELGVSTGNNW
jgi:hypothetical protein